MDGFDGHGHTEKRGRLETREREIVTAKGICFNKTWILIFEGLNWKYT